MPEKLGRQLPTQSVILSYSKSDGKKAVALYNKSKNKVLKWQAALLDHIMARDKSGLWVHSKFGLAVSRRNGKSEVAIARTLHGLVAGEKIIYTAHRTATSHSAWERVCDLLAKAGYKEKEDYTTLKQFGFETINMLHTGGRVNFRTRSSKGGLGEGYDLLVIDEAQEYTDDQESALKYIVSASQNPQTFMLGTPPTVSSSGTVFQKFRTDVLSGNAEYSGWAEWSIDHLSDPHDKKLWYLTNPSLGTILTERKISAEYTGDDVDFNIQRFGLWLFHNLKSAISADDWSRLKCDKVPKLHKSLFVGIKFGIDGENLAMSVAVKTTSGHIFIEGIDCRPIRDGYKWILDYLSKLHAKAIIIDGASGQATLEQELKQAKIKGCVLPKVKEIVQANYLFEQGVFGNEVCHMDQPALTQVATNCEKRNIGSNGGFGYKAQKEGIEIALLDSAILAFWACHEHKERKKQQIYY